MNYQVMELDVWTDAEGHYEKNNFYNVGEIELSDSFDRVELISKLTEFGYNASFLDSALIEDYNADGEYIEVLNPEGYPLIDLKLML
jgi:hypothetical protein